jgi:DnaJ-class molecular chaperone
MKCPQCKGEGYDPPDGVTKCPKCGGSGEVPEVGPPPDGGDGGGTGN